ncbi:hypothetical protein HUJ05_001470 [Dendroctonus ponderosae]|nr:hypothetical protein HUJ05_001470 [Dendroctonus ponderosae]
MSERSLNPSDSQDIQPTQQSYDPGEGATNKNNVISIASKQISDVIQFQEPNTSKNFSFTTEIRINILGEPNLSKQSFDAEDLSSLSLVNENGFRGKKDVIQLDESYATIESCLKEKTTNTQEVTMFSRNDRTQREIVVNSEAPPPYNSHPPPAYSTATGQITRQTQRYQTNPDPEGGYYPYGLTSPSLMDQRIRHYFIQKVFLILSVQLLITTGLILLVMFHEPTKDFVATNIPMFWVMAALEMVLYITLTCYQVTRRIFPLNFVLLLLFTLALSYICAAATIFYSTKVLLLTTSSTALICLVVSLLAIQTWFDITKYTFIIAVASIVFMAFGLIVMIVSLVTYTPVLWLVYSGIATLIFSVFLLYDMQCILGGRRQEISPEEYIYAALTLYVDIVMIFMYMLELINACTT